MKDSPLFLCGSHGCDVLYSSPERDAFVHDEVERFSRAYRARHGEFPDIDLQVDAIIEAEEAYDRRMAMRASAPSTPTDPV